MMAPTSILQISDLHRDPRNPISNAVLLSSLNNDRRRYSQEDAVTLRPPDIIVVSGDVIQGVAPGTADYNDRLKEQHAEALDFIVQLTNQLLAGDRDRVVIVPGNHDVSACHFMETISRLDIAADRRKELVEALFRTDSYVRWSWQDFALYEVTDRTRYADRLAPFAAFYDDFYEGRRVFDLDPAKQYEIFDFPAFDLTIVGFSSCYHNDFFNKQGKIHPASIADVNRRLDDPQYNGRLRIAVWHHNTEGLPMHSDYMDAGTLQNLIDCGFRIGMHGHQHRPDCLDTRFRYGGDTRITVVSAGTLCGSASFGHRRSYNLIELWPAEHRGRLHVREMQNSDLLAPIWGSRPLPPDTSAFREFIFDAPPEPLVRAHGHTATLINAQRHYENGEYAIAVTILDGISALEPLARPLLLECLRKLDDRPGIISRFDPPTGPTEIIHLMDALWIEKRVERLRELLATSAVADSTDPSIVEMRRKLAARMAR